MASLNFSSALFQSLCLRWCELVVGRHTSACGGGSGDKRACGGANQLFGVGRQVGINGLPWGFDNGANVAPGRTFLPTPGAEALHAHHSASALSTTRQVQEVAGKVGTACISIRRLNRAYAWLQVVVHQHLFWQCAAVQPIRLFQCRWPCDSRMTVAMWVRADKIDATSVCTTCSVRKNPRRGPRWFHSMRLIDGKPTLSMYPDSAFGWDPDFVVFAPSAISAGEWHHIAVTYNDIHAMVYVDGLVVVRRSPAA